ncbi:multiprotein bridging factor aMBF1 [Nanoarchaeota archaeon]
MNCDLCGKETKLFKAEVEGTEMMVCKNCASFGQLKEPLEKPAKKVHQFSKRERKEPALETAETIISDYAQKIRQAREKMGLSQEDFAKKINEKESLLHKMEVGSFEPSLVLAKKLEKLLGIKLIQKTEEKKIPLPKGSSEGFTIGDLMKSK